jgi:hypothetical protein
MLCLSRASILLSILDVEVSAFVGEDSIQGGYRVRGMVVVTFGIAALCARGLGVWEGSLKGREGGC